LGLCCSKFSFCSIEVNPEIREPGEIISSRFPVSDSQFYIEVMNSQELAQYIETTNSISKPWLLVQLRLKKLQDRRAEISHEDYIQELAELHQELMNLGEWWLGIEDEVFG